MPDYFPRSAVLGSLAFAVFAAYAMLVAAVNMHTLFAPIPVALTVTAPPPAAGAAITGAGVLTVGVDLDPGAYQTLAGPSCYWALLTSTTGSPDDVAKSGHGPGPVGIDTTGYAALATVGCGNWTSAKHAERPGWLWLP